MNNNIDKMCFADLIKKGVIRIPLLHENKCKTNEKK